MTAQKANPRSLIGMLGLVLGLCVYAILVTALAGWLPSMHLAVETVFYLFFGIVWIFPARSLLNWIGRGAPETD